MSRRVVFRADGNADIGYGHFIRTLGLASLINTEFECVFATQEPTPYQIEEIYNVCSGLIELSKSERHLDEFLSHLRDDDIVVIDDYTSDFDYQNTIRNKGCRVIYIDDHNDKHYVCDSLINNIPGFERDSFDLEDYTKLYLGTDYALLRKEFFNPVLRSVAKKHGTLFLSFGGSDSFNISEKLLIFINEISGFSEVNLMIGDGYKHYEKLSRFNNLNIYKNISAAEVASLIAEAEICVITASSLLNEASSIGSKILVGYFADNQIQPYNYFVENNLAVGLGDYRKIDLELFKKKLEEVRTASSLIENQRKKYRYQQEKNLKKVFYDV